jgi:hypothetical protein
MDKPDSAYGVHALHGSWVRSEGQPLFRVDTEKADHEFGTTIVSLPVEEHEPLEIDS